MTTTETQSKKEVLKKFGITQAQMEVLVYAARKHKYTGAEELHDGEISGYNVRQKSLDALIQKQYIARDYKISDDDARANLEEEARSILDEAWSVARCYGPREPVKMSTGELEAWKVVKADIDQVFGRYERLRHRCWKITPLGRVAVQEYSDAE